MQGSVPVEIIQLLTVTDRHALVVTATRPVGSIGLPGARVGEVLDGLRLGEGA